jgi:hypothetical protein
LHGRRCGFGAGGGFFVRGHRIILSLLSVGWSGELPFLLMKLSALLGFATPLLQICAN